MLIHSYSYLHILLISVFLSTAQRARRVSAANIFTLDMDNANREPPFGQSECCLRITDRHSASRFPMVGPLRLGLGIFRSLLGLCLFLLFRRLSGRKPMHSPDDHYPLNRHLNRHFSHLVQAFAITMILWFGSFLFISSLRKSKSAIDRITLISPFPPARGIFG